LECKITKKVFSLQGSFFTITYQLKTFQTQSQHEHKQYLDSNFKRQTFKQLNSFLGAVSCYPLYLFLAKKPEKGCRCYQG
jgi:hypothetical protein